MNKAKAVIVDDERFNRLFISKLLIQAGFDVVGEGSQGRDAVDLYRAHRPDLLLLDIAMPGQDGFAALAELHAQFPEANVVMLTSLADRTAVQKCAQLGARGYILKTNPREKTMALLRKYLPSQTETPAS